MDDQVNELRFRMIDPYRAGEHWASERAVNKSVEIYIDGKEILDILRPIEAPYLEKEDLHFEPGADYGHVTPGHLAGDLEDALLPWGDAGDSRVYFCCCGSCGEPGCWSVTAKIRYGEDYVEWYDFEHSHRDWEYRLRFRFDRKQYDEAVKKLKAMAKNQKIRY